jgi:hypothetical protein
MLAEIPDADDSHSQRHRWLPAPFFTKTRPTHEDHEHLLYRKRFVAFVCTSCLREKR